MPWNDIQDTVKALKGQLELANPNLVVGGVRAHMDPAAQNAGMKVTSGALGTLIGSRVTKDLVMPVAPAVVAGLAPIIDRNRVAKPDRWSERLVALSPRERLTPVRIGIWDTGVDMALFKAAGAPGMAFDDAGNPVPNLLRDLGEARSRWPELKGMTKGALDMRAERTTHESRAQGAVANSSRDAKRPELAWPGLHARNAFAESRSPAPRSRASSVSMHWNHGGAPPLTTEERTRARPEIPADRRRLQAGRRARRQHELALRQDVFEGRSRYTVSQDTAEPGAAMQLFAIERDALRRVRVRAGDTVLAGSGKRTTARLSKVHSAGFELPNSSRRGRRSAGERRAF